MVVGIQEEVFEMGGVVPVGNNSSRVGFAMVAVRSSASGGQPTFG